MKDLLKLFKQHAPVEHFDLDGVSNIREYLFGMNPALADAETEPKVTLTKHASIANAWTLGFPTIPDRVYQFQRSATLQSGAWQPLGSASSTSGAAAPGTLQVDDTSADPARFYRMSVSPSH